MTSYMLKGYYYEALVNLSVEIRDTFLQLRGQSGCPQCLEDPLQLAGRQSVMNCLFSQ